MGQLEERCRLQPQTNFFLFKKSPKTECGLDSRIYGRFLMCQKWMVIFLHKSILNISDIKVASQSHTHSLDLEDNKAKHNMWKNLCESGHLAHQGTAE
jgi:hypothetical protein